jgi:hypothetical protein
MEAHVDVGLDQKEIKGDHLLAGLIRQPPAQASRMGRMGEKG